MTLPLSTSLQDAPNDDLRGVELLSAAQRQIVEQIGKRIIGHDAVVEHLLVALFARGHCLFVGVPGLAKTLLISTLAEVLNLDFNRIQFTPDLVVCKPIGVSTSSECVLTSLSAPWVR